MYDDDFRCPECDGRYCPPSECARRPGYVWVVGKGWKDPETAAALERAGFQVQW
jgi:hypothetical protein